MNIAVVFAAADGKLAETTAQETAWYLGQLYRDQVRCVKNAGTSDIGDVELLVAIGQAAQPFDSTSPKLASDELHVVARQAGQRWEVLLRGGSPLATHAAAMRFLEHRGVLLGPLQDFLPDEASQLNLAPVEIRERPRRPLFGPHYWVNFPMDPSSFSREQWLRLVRGWSRMRATVMGYHFYQAFPWYDVEMRGFKDQSGYFFYSQRHPLAPQIELRYGIKNRSTFISPDVESFAEDGPRVHAWAQETMRQAMALAHELGMKNSLTFEPFGTGLPQTYLVKMKEWNGGNPVDPKNRLHPLIREYAVCAIRSILQTYPDLDILKLVSGEMGTLNGTPQELTSYITELMGGNLNDRQGRPVALPTDPKALAVLADALTSCKLAKEAVDEARKQGILRDGLQLAIGCYPGSNLKVQPTLFLLAGRLVDDPAIRLHFLPAHGMGLSATAMQLAKPEMFEGRKLEISGWTELDGIMYVPQSCLRGIHTMNDTLDSLPAEALYAIQWRVASTTFDNAFFVRSQWDRSLTPQQFWKDLAPLFGTEGSDLLCRGMEQLEANGETSYGFCYFGCWGKLLPEELNGVPASAGKVTHVEKKKRDFAAMRDLAAQAGQQAPSEDGRRLSQYFTNKLECAMIHMDYWREIVLACTEMAADSGRSREIMQAHAVTMLDCAKRYLLHYQEAMLDRTDEGMLASYWIVAGQFAYRYAHRQRYDESNIFQPRPAKAEATSAVQPEEVKVLAPRVE